MTIRHRKRIGASPADVARYVPVEFADVETIYNYREYFQSLQLQIEALTGVNDSGLAMSVAVELGTDLASWLERHMTKDSANIAPYT